MSDRLRWGGGRTARIAETCESFFEVRSGANHRDAKCALRKTVRSAKYALAARRLDSWLAIRERRASRKGIRDAEVAFCRTPGNVKLEVGMRWRSVQDVRSGAPRTSGQAG